MKNRIIRKTTQCKKFCDGVGCYEELVTKVIFDKERTFWQLHCKRLEKAEQQAFKIISKL